MFLKYKMWSCEGGSGLQGPELHKVDHSWSREPSADLRSLPVQDGNIHISPSCPSGQVLVGSGSAGFPVNFWRRKTRIHPEPWTRSTWTFKERSVLRLSFLSLFVFSNVRSFYPFFLPSFLVSNLKLIYFQNIYSFFLSLLPGVKN